MNAGTIINIKDAIDLIAKVWERVRQDFQNFKEIQKT